MELSEVRCSSAAGEELYAVNNKTTQQQQQQSAAAAGNGGTRPKRLLWQNAVRHITEQRFIHEQTAGDGGSCGVAAAAAARGAKAGGGRDG